MDFEKKTYQSVLAQIKIGEFKKRTFDITIGSLLLLTGFPFIFVAACIMAYKTKSFPFFLQERIGLYGDEIRILKMKTMKDGFGCDEERVAGIWGKIIRKLHVDELVQLPHVIFGTMSLVGPRPVLKHAPDAAFYVRTIGCKPGIAGKAQNAGRNGSESSYEEAVIERNLKNDLDYIAACMVRYSLREDFKILLATIPAVVRQRNDRHSSKSAQIFNMSASGKSKSLPNYPNTSFVQQDFFAKPTHISVSVPSSDMSVKIYFQKKASNLDTCKADCAARILAGHLHRHDSGERRSGRDHSRGYGCHRHFEYS